MAGDQIQRGKKITQQITAQILFSFDLYFSHQLNLQSTKRKQYFDDTDKTLRIQGRFHHNKIH